MKKIFLSLIFILLIFIIYFFTPVRDYLSKAPPPFGGGEDSFEALEIWIRSQGVLAPLAFGLIYIAATVFALPGSALTIGGGLLFGTLWGTAINLTSATIGAMLAFLIARYLGRGVVAKLLRSTPKLGDLDEKIGKHGFYSILFLRLVPLFPFNALNYGLGLTKVTFKDYAFATAIGMLPGSFVYTSLGAIGRHVDFKDLNTWTDYHVWGPFVLVIVLSLVSKLFKFLRTKQNQEQI